MSGRPGHRSPPLAREFLTESREDAISPRRWRISPPLPATHGESTCADSRCTQCVFGVGPVKRKRNDGRKGKLLEIVGVESRAEEERWFSVVDLLKSFLVRSSPFSSTPSSALPPLLIATSTVGISADPTRTGTTSH